MSLGVPAASTAPRLTRRVLRHVMLPLALTWLVGTCVATGVASWFAGQAFDRALLDDAYSLSSNVHLDAAGEPQIALTPGEVKSLLFDQVEQVYFAVLRGNGSLVAGHAGLHATSPEAGAAYAFSDISHLGHALRAVTVAHPGPRPWQVVVAQTMNSRTALLERVLAYSVVPQIALLVLLAAWLWRRLQDDLRPLGELQQALALRDANDLAPVAVVRNSREIEGLASAVNALFERLGHSVRGQREFAGNVAHELRTPLAGIRALAEYGLAHNDPAVWREQLQRVAASQARASHLVDQLLALALVDEARAALQREPVRLDEVAQQTVLRHLARADAQGTDLGARGLEEPVTVRASAALVEGILNNLVDNALRYGVRAGGGGTVTVELAGTTLSVVDDGPGIPPEQQRALTQRGAQGPDGHALGAGAGLGLSIVARYAQLLGAELTLANDPASGGLRASVAFDMRI